MVTLQFIDDIKINNMKNKGIVFLLLIIFCSPSIKSYKTNDFYQQNSKVEEADFASNKVDIALSDTVIFSLCDIDGDFLNDTIKTIVHIGIDTILIRYFWIKDNKAIWTLSDEDFVSVYPEDFSNDIEWIKYVKRHAAPDIFDKNTYIHAVEFYSEITVSDLINEGYSISLNEYKDYVTNFKGNLFSFGSPYLRNELLIWYEPLKMFVTFYQP